MGTKINMYKLLLEGALYGTLAQIITFLQLQGNIKWNWYAKYPFLVLAAAVPISILFIKSVEKFVAAFNGEIWPSRLIGFGIGIIVFYLMSYFLFNEQVTPKTFVCLILASAIIGVQVFWK
jgi:multidrug transporter EmrE-like cation transporter